MCRKSTFVGRFRVYRYLPSYRFSPPYTRNSGGVHTGSASPSRRSAGRPVVLDVPKRGGSGTSTYHR
jgi:hypothetical protein